MPVERFDKDSVSPPWVRSQHDSRYRWASEMVVDKVIIDAACGTGYGASHLARSGAKHVYAIDKSHDSIDLAKHDYRDDLIEFLYGDVCMLPIESSSIDVYVSFETVEHIDNVSSYLNEVSRVLKGDGMFLCSTPNRDLTNAGTSLKSKPFNQFHVREYSRAEFVQLLGAHFETVELYGQSPYSLSYVNKLASLGRFAAKLAVRLHQVQKVLTWFWRNDDFYSPKNVNDHEVEYEFLIAKCHKPKGAQFVR
jgi:ubiquinone/menaquinone biosynthesis C-methylase UbiE